MATQYLLPLAVISVVYGKIYNFLKVLNYLSQQETNNGPIPGTNPVEQSEEKETEKNHRDPAPHLSGVLSQVLASFTLKEKLLFFSWLPFSILRILTELDVDLHKETGNWPQYY